MPPPLRRYDLLSTRLDRLSSLLDGVARGDVDAVHHARVASRRLREVLPILGLDALATEKVAKQLRRITKQLGSVRELDVLAEQFDRARTQGRPGLHAIELVLETVQVERERVFNQVVKPLQLNLTRVIKHLNRMANELVDVDGRTTGRLWMWALEARVVKRSAGLSRAIEHAGAAYRPKRLHNVRIAVKKLRYSVELALDASGRRDNTDLAELRRSQELLGQLHDLQVLIDRVRTVQSSDEPASVMAWHEFDAAIASLEADRQRLHARYARSRSAIKGLCARLSQPAGTSARPPIRRAV